VDPDHLPDDDALVRPRRGRGAGHPERLDDVGILATPLEFHRPKLPGLGEVDWGRFFSVLSDIGYDGPVCVEVEDRAYEGSLELRQQALRQSLGFLRNFA